MFERFTDRARRVVVLAQEEAVLLNHNYIGTEHFLLGMVSEGANVAAKALEPMGIGLTNVRQQVEDIIGRGQQPPYGHIPFTPRSKKVLELSLREALQLGHNYIGPEHLMLGLVREGDGVACQVLVRLGADLDRVRQAVIGLMHGYAPIVSEEEAPAAVPEPSVVGRNLTRLARKGELDPVVGRQREIGQVMEILMLEAAVPLLVGDHGAGVNTVAYGVAQAMAQSGSSRWFAGKQLVELNLDQLTGPATNPHDLDDRVSDLITQIRDQRGTIWFIDNALSLAYTPTAQPAPAITLLRPVLATGELLAIATTTPAERQQYLTVDADLRGDFTDVEVNELPEHLAVEVLKSIRERHQAHHQVSIDDDVIAAAVALSVQHIPGTLLPGKAIDLLDRAAACAARRNPLRRLEESRDHARREKEAALDSQDFELAAAWRDREKQAMAALAQKQAELKNRPTDGIVAVTRQDLAAALTASPVLTAAAGGGQHV